METLRPCTGERMPCHGLFHHGAPFPPEAELKGLGATVSGLIFTAQPLLMTITSPLAGWLLPKGGSRFQIVSGLMVASVAQLTFGALTYVDQGQAFAVLCFVVRSAGAIGGETLMGLGVAIGPAIGGVLFSVGGFGLSFYFVGLAVLLAVPMIWTMFESQEYGTGIRETPSKEPPSKLSALRLPVVLITLISLTISSTSLTFLDPTFEPHMRIFNLTSSQVGLLTIGQSLIGTGYLCLGPSPATGISQTLVSDILSYIVICTDAAAAMIPTFTMLLGAMTAQGDDTVTHSFVSGLFSFAFNMGEILGTTLGGVFVDSFGFVSGSSTVAIFNFGTVLLLTIVSVAAKSGPRSKISDERSPLLSR
ncbi:MFS-type transporter SLC18B1 [Halotydeus destructor]|nr:MFS-type transporter SLC18B1 [Halotydeus destructor]